MWYGGKIRSGVYGMLALRRSVFPLGRIPGPLRLDVRRVPGKRREIGEFNGETEKAVQRLQFMRSKKRAWLVPDGRRAAKRNFCG